MQRKMLTLVLALSLALSLFWPVGGETENVAAQSQNVIGEGDIVSTVNFRTAPSTSSSTYGTLKRGEKVDILEEVNRHWLKVRAHNRTGYISSYPQYVNYDIGNTAGNQSSTSPSSTADRIIAAGLQYQGTPYLFGARSGQTSRFDCSSFTQYIFAQEGINLPRNSRQQSQMGTLVSSSNIKKGDLLFFNTGSRSDGRIDHVAVYAGNNRILHAIPNGGVQVNNVNSYWRSNFVGAKRVIR